MSSPSFRVLRSLFLLSQYAFLVAVSLLLLPASVLALSYNYAALVLCPQDGLRRHVRRSPRFRPQKVIITGISTPAGLRVARALYHTGHNVIGVDDHGYKVLRYARWSKAVSRLYIVPVLYGRDGDSRYAEKLFRVIVKERANLWIDCSDGCFAQAMAHAKDAVEARSACVCLVPNVEQLGQFESRHGFQKLVQQLGLPAPETHAVRSRHDIYNVLNTSDGKKYLLSSPNGRFEPTKRAILPSRTVSQTYSDVAQLHPSKGPPWTLEEYIEGSPHFTACAIIARGELKGFAPSSTSDSGDCRSVSARSGISDAMKQYMESFASAMGSSLTLHLTMEFRMVEKATQAGVVQQILPLSGKVTPHESLLLFDGKRGSIDLTRAYLAVLPTSTTTELEAYTGLPYSHSTSTTIVPAEAEFGVYSIHHDLEKLVVGPLLRLITLRSSVSEVARAWVTCLHHVVSWQERLYEFGDPLPLFWYTHVTLPCQLISDVLQEAWSRLSSIRSRSVQKKISGQVMQNGR